MDQYDVEEVLIIAIKVLGLKTKEPLSFPDIFDIAYKVMQHEHFQAYMQIKKSNTEETYALSRSDLEKIMLHGDLEITYDTGKTVNFFLEENDVKTMKLENGGVLIWYEGDEE
jgi:hypothetical protein